MAKNRLGIYRLESKIGKGGMGSVYLAYDPTLKRRVAIKVLPARLAADRDYVARCEREATTLAQIRHPNLMHIYAVGQDRGLHYIAMEYIQGRTLAELIKQRGPLPVADAARILSQTLAALGKVHAAGIVHRDLKPANILIDDDGRAVLMDFGLAKPRYDRSVTTESIILGTPEYMAPELAEGADADFRSEIYACGILFFEMLIGKVPFRASSAIGTLREHIEKSVPSACRLRPDLPLPIDAMLAKALAKKPEERYPDVQAFAADLAVIAGAMPTTATVPLGAIQAPATETAATLVARRADEGPRRRPWIYAAAGGAVVLVVAVLALAWPRGGGTPNGEPSPRGKRGAAASHTPGDARGGAAAPSSATPATKKAAPARKGLPCVVTVRGAGVRALPIKGRLLAIEGEGGEVVIEEAEGRIRRIPYREILRIQPTGGE